MKKVALLLVIILIPLFGYSQKFPKINKNKGYKVELKFTEKFQEDISLFKNGVEMEYLYTRADIEYYFISNSRTIYHLSFEELGEKIDIWEVFQYEIGEDYIIFGTENGDARKWIFQEKNGKNLRYIAEDGYVILNIYPIK